MTLQVFLLLVPLLTLGSGLVLYRFTGRKQLFKLDSIQFFYAFILAPVFFIWAKTLFFTIIRNEVAIQLSQGEIFILDTIFSLFLLYVYAFVVIHSLTKSFNLETANDPLYDMFLHSEYFHLWITHLWMYGGGMVMLTVFAVANIFFPLTIEISKTIFTTILFSGIFSGTIMFLTIWLSDPKQARSFMRLMKLLAGILFVLHVGIYFLVSPSFNGSYAMYWWSTFTFATMVVYSLFAYKSTSAQLLIERFSHRFKHEEWDFRLQLFGKKK